MLDNIGEAHRAHDQQSRGTGPVVLNGRSTGNPGSEGND
jgi:hypothetical protein